MLLQQIQMNSTEFQPLADYILIKPDDVETDEYTQGGIIIQHKKSITNRPTAGVILAKGKDCTEVEVTHRVELSFSTRNLSLTDQQQELS